MSDLGWVFPNGSRKAHWIDSEGRSLCRRYGFVRVSMNDLTVGAQPGPDDCRECWRRAVQRSVADDGAEPK